MKHLQNLQDIAEKNSGSRTATTGYNPSVDYVYGLLNKYNSYFDVKKKNLIWFNSKSKYTFFLFLAQDTKFYV
jgi:hypothetical protein